MALRCCFTLNLAEDCQVTKILFAYFCGANDWRSYTDSKG